MVTVFRLELMRGEGAAKDSLVALKYWTKQANY